MIHIKSCKRHGTIYYIHILRCIMQGYQSIMAIKGEWMDDIQAWVSFPLPEDDQVVPYTPGTEDEYDPQMPLACTPKSVEERPFEENPSNMRSHLRKQMKRIYLIILHTRIHHPIMTPQIVLRQRRITQPEKVTQSPDQRYRFYLAHLHLLIGHLDFISQVQNKIITLGKPLLYPPRREQRHLPFHLKPQKGHAPHIDGLLRLMSGLRRTTLEFKRQVNHPIIHYKIHPRFFDQYGDICISSTSSSTYRQETSHIGGSLVIEDGCQIANLQSSCARLGSRY